MLAIASHTVLISIAVAFFISPSSVNAGEFKIVEENDWFYHAKDRDYTQGARISYTFDILNPGDKTHRYFDAAANYLPMFGGDKDRRQWEWIALGQNIYTPRDKSLVNPDPADRPYAGWLYTGISFMQDHGSQSLDHAELLIGVVGPAAAAKATQKAAHEILSGSAPQGWGYQIKNEPGIALSLEKKWRYHQPIGSQRGFGVEVIPESGLTIGNVWTYAQAGAVLRLGQNLLANYGTPRIRPAPSGTSYFNPELMTTLVGWNVYAGAQGRAVAHNIFLDGNTFSDSRSVDKKLLVGTATAGLSLYMRTGPNFDFAYVWCSQDFDMDRGCSHYGGANIGWKF